MNQPSEKTPALYLELESIRTALEAMQGRKPFPSDHPLVYMLCMRLEGTSGLIGIIATETIIYSRLAALIQRRLNRFRTYFGLSPVTRNADLETVKHNIQEDFQIDSADLKAASLLYYRYVRVELDLSLDTLEKLTGEVDRNLQRRQSRGIARLTQAIIHWEYRLRRKNLQAVHRAKLPFPVAPHLTGRDDLFIQAIGLLLGTDLPLHLLLYGAAGVGKSILALVLAHRLIDQLPLSNVIWIDTSTLSPDQLLQEIYVGLGLPIPSTEILPSAFLQADILIVLDNAQHLIEDMSAASSILRRLGVARVILVSEQPNVALNLHHLRIPELDKESAIKLMEQLANKLNTHDADDVDYFNKLYSELGGNPGLLRKALGVRQHYTAPLITAPIYGEYWFSISDLARTMWLTLMLSVDGQLPLDTLHRTFENVDENELHIAIEELEHHSVIEVRFSTVRLHALGRAYGELILREGTYPHLTTRAAQYIVRDLGAQPDLARSVRILSAIPEIGLPSELMVDIAYSLKAIIHCGGAWSVWARCLDFLQTLTESDDRLWIGMELGIARRWLAQWKIAKYTFGEVIEQAGQQGAFEIQHDALLELALIQRHEQQYDSALTLIHQARAFFERHNLHDKLGRALIEETRTYLAQNRLSEAQQLLIDLDVLNNEQSLDLAQLFNLRAQVDFASGALEQALYYAHRTQHEQRGDLPHTARTSALLGQIYHALGKRRAAIDHLSGALTLMEQTEDRLGYARARMNLAAVYIGQGNFRTALTYLRGLPDDFEQLGDEESLQTTKANLDILNNAIRRWKRQP